MGDAYFSGGFWNNIIDLSLTVVIVFASLAATVLATSDLRNIPRWLVASIAAVPAAATSLQRIIGIRERSDWYFLYAAKVRGLATTLKYAAAPNIEEFGKRVAEVEIEMENEWLKIGRGAQPSHQPHDSASHTDSGGSNADIPPDGANKRQT
ncbi:MAG: hypothetical protein JO091_03730 [Acidobacteriaceae bacterium]|nr:hypothetical protein [Acidobacteriaceae bacterium]